MRLLWVLAFPFARFAVGQNVLAIGDSVDRFMTEDFCTTYGPSKKAMCGGGECTYWADGILKPNLFPTASMRCEVSSNSSLAFVGVYGSPDSGPYYEPKSQKSSGDSWHTNTQDRIHVVIDGYFTRIGVPPDLVLFHSVLWDIALLYLRHGGPWDWTKKEFPKRGDYAVVNSTLYNSACTGFEAQMRRRIDDIEVALARNMNLSRANHSELVGQIRARIGLRAAVYNSEGGALIRGFNQVMHRLAQELGLTFYDYDYDVWSRVNYDTAKESLLLRDRIHPNQEMCRSAGAKLMRLDYTNALVKPRACGSPFPLPSPSSASPGSASTSGGSGGGGNGGSVGNGGGKPWSPCDAFPKVWWAGSQTPRPTAGLSRVLLLQEQQQEEARVGSANVSSVSNANGRGKSKGKGRGLTAGTSSSSNSGSGPGSGPGSSASEKGIFDSEKEKPASFFLAISDPSDNAIKARLHGVSSALLKLRHLGPADALPLSPQQLATIPLGPPIPHTLFQPGVKTLVNTTSGLWLVLDGERRLIPPSALPFYNISTSVSRPSSSSSSADQRSSWERQQLDARVEESFLASLVPHIGPPIPDIYSQGSLLRFVGSRQVFVLLDGQLHAVPSANVFFKRGWDFSSVVIVVNQRDMDVIPMGEPLPE